jgi:hypothetical protein
MKDERRVLPKDVDQLKKAGASYVNDGKWFKQIQEEGYAASQSDHSSPTAKLTSSYLHPQVRRHGLVRRRTWCVHLHSHARETRAEKLKARAATRPQLPKHKKREAQNFVQEEEKVREFGVTSHMPALESEVEHACGEEDPASDKQTSKYE